jgi:hypothetical protein
LLLGWLQDFIGYQKKMIRKYPHILITVMACLLFIPYLGAVHLFDWDEINFAEAAREMIVSSDYSRVQINFEPFWEKPPLFFWFQVLSMKIFGINEFAARFPNAICGMITLNFLFYYGRIWYSDKMAWWWVLLYIGSFTPHFYFKSGIIDPFFNLFIFLAIVQLYQGVREESKRTKYFLISGLLLGLALLTKGPVAIIIVGLCGLVYLITKRFKPFFNLKQFLLLFFGMLFIPLLWFLPDWIKNGFWFTGEFLKYQADLFLNPVASHGQPWFYHPVVLIIGCFPATIFAMPYLFKNPPLNAGGLAAWLKIMFWVVLILFSMVTTKIVHYSSLCYIPLAFLGAWGLYNNQGLLRNWQKILLSLVGLIYGLIFCLLPILASNKQWQLMLSDKIKDDFAKANLSVVTNWQGTEWILGVLFIVLIGVSLLIYNFRSKEIGIRFLLGSNALFIFFVSVLMIPKIENHVQGSIISFYKKIRAEDAYLETVGFKSYAHYYYTQKPMPNANEKLNTETRNYCKQQNIDTIGQLSESQRNQVSGFKKQWYLEGVVDKPVYLVYKITNLEGIDTNSKFKLVFNEGGYKVFKREH